MGLKKKKKSVETNTIHLSHFCPNKTVGEKESKENKRRRKKKEKERKIKAKVCFHLRIKCVLDS